MCLFCQTLRYTCIPFESFAFHANLYYGLNLCLGIYMYTSCLSKHTYALKFKLFLMKTLVLTSFMYSCLKEIQLSLVEYFHDYVYHFTLVHSPYLLVSHDFVFMSMIRAI